MSKKCTITVLVILSLLVVFFGISTLSLLLKQRRYEQNTISRSEAQAISQETANAAILDAAKAKVSVPLTVTPIQKFDTYYDSYLFANFCPVEKNLLPPTNGVPIKVSPEVKNFSWKVLDNGRVRLDGDFKDDTSYTFTFASGWATSSGLKLSSEIERSYKTAKAIPILRAISNGLFYPASRDGIKFPISSLGVEEYEVSIFKAYDSNLPIYGFSSVFWSNWAIIFQKSALIVKGYAKITGPKDLMLHSMLDLSQFMTNFNKGFYKVELFDKKTNARDEFSFALTDLAPQVFTEPGVNSRLLVFVTGFSDAKAISGAKVVAYTKTHQIAGTATTDSRGLAIIKPDPRFKYDDNEKIVGVEVRTEDDFTYIDFDCTNLKEASNSFKSYNGPSALVFSERELCRPGETFESSVLVRTAAKDGSKAMTRAPVELSLYDANYNLIESRRLVTDDHGLASTSWKVPVDAAVGEWMVHCKVGSSKLHSMPMYIAAYVPDRFAVGLKSSVDEVVGFDNKVEFIGNADYYFGEPVANGDCKITFIVDRAKKPRHWRDWTVGTNLPFNQKMLKVEPELENGKFSYTYSSLKENSVSGASYPVALTALADVQEPGGRTVSASDTVTYFETDWYLGLREGKTTDDKVSFDVTLLPAVYNTTNSTLPFNEISISLARKEWKRHLVSNYSQSKIDVDWREELVKLDELSKSLKISVESPCSYTGCIEYASNELPAGQYILTVKGDNNTVSTIEFWHWEGESSERTQNIADLILTPLAPSFKPGDKAEVSFYAPNSGSLLVVAGVNGINDYLTQEVVAGKNVISLQIPSDIIAGCYNIFVTLVSDGANGTMRRLVGTAKLKIDTTQSRLLNVALDFPEKVLPRETAKVKVTLKNRNGEPVSGVVKIGAIDEGVAAMSNFHVVNAYKHFYERDFGLPFSFFDFFHLIYPELKLLPDGTFGGDLALMAPSKRRDSIVKQKETARFTLPPIYVSTNGVATVDVTFPDHLGALRLTAVAANDSAVGSTEETIILRNKISVVPSAPRFAVGGDRFKLTSTIFNHETDEGEWTLEVALPDGLSSDGKTILKRNGRLAKGASTIEDFEMAIANEAQGDKTISFKLTLGNSVVEEKVFITVRPQMATVTSVEYLALTNGVLDLASLADDWHSNTLSKVELSSMPLLAISESLEWLAEYPYGCLEQTTSAAFPFLVAGDLLKLGVIDETLDAQANLKVKEAFALIMQMQCGDGSFAMWPNGRSPWIYGSIFANHFIFEAEMMGLLKIDNRFRNLQRSWLRDVAANAAPENRMDRAYAVYALAVNGDSSFIINALNVISQGDDDFAALVVSAAMMRFGYASEGIAIFEKAIASRAWETESDWDRIKNLGMTLFMAAKAGYRDYAKLTPIIAILNNSLRDDGSAWGTTRDNSWSVLGLASFAQMLEIGNATGTVKIGTVEKEFNVSQKPFVVERKIDDLIQIHSKDMLFAKVETVGIPKKPIKRNNMISISKSYVDDDGNPISKVASGSLITVVVNIASPVDIDRTVLVDLVPGGFELEDVTLATRSSVIPNANLSNNSKLHGSSEIRDDRWLWFGYLPKANKDTPSTITYTLRAVTPGVYTIPQIIIEDMYNPDLRGDYIPGKTIVIE